MKCRIGKTWASLFTVLAVGAGSGLVEAQTDRALERRIDRNERQIQRQANRVDYYSADTWQQLNPWIQQAGVAPFSGTAAPARNPVAAAGNAVKQTVDAATRIGDGQFGYQDKSPQSAWFYDYYTVSPTYYVPQGDDRYASAVRYFDRDNDGVFEALSNYRDSDNDGRYDEYDQLDFYQSPANDSNATVEDRSEDKLHSVYEGPEDSRRHRLAGEIAMTKIAKVEGHENLVVALKTTDEATPAIDLGPVDGMQGKHVEVGTQVVANGALQQVGDKQLLIADTVQIGNGKPFGIDRSFGQSYTGEIVDIKTVQINSADYYMAVVNIDGEPQLVDLGPTTSYKVALKPASRIMIQGVPVRTSDHRVILAQQIKLGKDNIIRIERSRQF